MWNGINHFVSPLSCPGTPQDPNARNCHGYRKFVKRSVLEDLTRGFLVNDTIIIRYTIELVVTQGECNGSSGSCAAQKASLSFDLSGAGA